MARKPRVHYAGALYHVVLRGNAGQVIFDDDEDRTQFYLLAQEGIERFGHRIHAFCLMNNHVHLAIQVGVAPLSRIIQNLSFRYTRWVNGRRKRCGHLFQGRYKAVLVDADSYLDALTRYIHLNPVRAGIVKAPKDYRWSGHRAYLGLEKIPWLTTDWVLLQFSERLVVARRIYEKYVAEGKEEGHQAEYHQGSEMDSRILGDDRFIDRVLGPKRSVSKSKIGLEGIWREVCGCYSVDESRWKGGGRERRLSEARGMAAWLVLESGVGTLVQLGRLTGRDPTTLSSAAKRLQKRAQEDLPLAKRMKQLLEASS
jgi:REP-associated tyrosine transposase